MKRGKKERRRENRENDAYSSHTFRFVVDLSEAAPFFVGEFNALNRSRRGVWIGRSDRNVESVLSRALNNDTENEFFCQWGEANDSQKEQDDDDLEIRSEV